MQVDAIQHKGKQLMRPKAQGRPLLRKPGISRLAPHPMAGPLKPTSPSPRQPPTPPKFSDPKPRIFHCYKCAQPGHFAGDCPVNVRALDHTHIRAMEQALASIYQEQGFEEEEPAAEETDPQEDNSLAILEHEPADEESDLIDFLGQLDAQAEEWQNGQEEEQEPSFI